MHSRHNLNIQSSTAIVYLWLIQNYNRFFRAIAIQALLPSPGKTEYYLNDHQSFEGIA